MTKNTMKNGRYGDYTVLEGTNGNAYKAWYHTKDATYESLASHSLASGFLAFSFPGEHVWESPIPALQAAARALKPVLKKPAAKAPKKKPAADPDDGFAQPKKTLKSSASSRTYSSAYHKEKLRYERACKEEGIEVDKDRANTLARAAGQAAVLSM